jgi:hypothetical protein
MTDLYLKRLMPEDPTAWGYWPIFEARIRAAVPLLEPEADPEKVVMDYRSLWAQPGRLGAWLILKPVERTNGHVPLPQVIGHIAAYVDSYHGEPCLMVHQVEGIPWEGCLELRDPLLHEWDAWKDALNARYEQAMAPQRIDLVRFYTRFPAAAERWFREVVEVRRGGTLVSFRLSEVAVPSGGA